MKEGRAKGLVDGAVLLQQPSKRPLMDKFFKVNRVLHTRCSTSLFLRWALFGLLCRYIKAKSCTRQMWLKVKCTPKWNCKKLWGWRAVCCQPSWLNFFYNSLSVYNYLLCQNLLCSMWFGPNAGIRALVRILMVGRHRKKFYTRGTQARGVPF